MSVFKFQTQHFLPANIRILFFIICFVPIYAGFSKHGYAYDYINSLIIIPSLILLLSNTSIKFDDKKITRIFNLHIFKIKNQVYLDKDSFVSYKSSSKTFSATKNLRPTAKEYYNKSFHEIFIWTSKNRKTKLCNVKSKEDAIRILNILQNEHGLKLKDKFR